MINYTSLPVLGLSGSQNKRFYCLELLSPKWSWSPGQFVMLRPKRWDLDPFCPRPFSISDQDKDRLSIYFQVLGRGTKSLAELKTGELVNVWGPLGQGFDWQENIPTLLLAGGMGIVSFLGLVNRHNQPQNLELIFGHRQALSNYVPYQTLAEKISSWTIQDKTEQDLKKLERSLQVKIEKYSQEGQILACGPRPFLKMIQRLSSQYKANTQISLETYMACGIGACLGCAIKTKNHNYAQACLHGPVFKADQIILE